MDDAQFAKLTRGRIVLACVTDMQARNPKVRPVVLLTPPPSDDPDAVFRVACGSRTPPEGANTAWAVRVSGSIGPQGQSNARSGLPEPTWFYAGWVRKIAVGEVVSLKKFVSEPELLRLIEMVEALALAALPKPATTG